MIRTIVVEDSKLVGHALVDRLNDMPEIEVVAMLENAANSVVACAGRNIDLVLMDVCTLNDESGLEATSRIKRDSPSTKVIVMTSMPEYTFPEKARLAGADSFWYKDYGNSGLSDVVRRTLADESVWPGEIDGRLSNMLDDRGFLTIESEPFKKIELIYFQE